eukprot:TRINITY_DN20096_c0_g1_i3.p1 TRINITY_DN20096_c0_g1~~TRINITY_DN20096_c0_g1_i3.p1  ORF type:complete len:183 (+),score=31.46 TRINITY_DN20096_c0_g1_i3:30-551(+)
MPRACAFFTSSEAPLFAATERAGGHGGNASSFHVYGKWHPPGPPDPMAKYAGFERTPREQVPLCEDLRPGVLYETEKCWSTCGLPGEEDCKPRVLTLPEDYDLEMIKHPMCKSHVECVGKPARVLCEAARKGSWMEGLKEARRADVGFLLFLPPAACEQGKREHFKSFGHTFL